MRKPVVAVLMALLLGVAFAGELNQTLRFDRGELNLGQQFGFTTVDYGNAPHMDRVGAPALPELAYQLVVPPTATVTGVTVTNIEEEALDGTYDVLPTQHTRAYRADDPEPPFVAPDAAIYGSGEAYPKDLFAYQATGDKGGFRVAGFLVRPVRYVPAQRKLYVVRRAEVSVRYEEGQVPRARRFPEYIKLMGSDLASIVANPEDVSRFAPVVTRHGDPSPFLPPGHFEHVIVSPQVYADSFNRLRDWRTLQGLPSKIMVMEDICATYPGRDTAEKIRNFIKDAVTTWGTAFVFLPRRDVPGKEHRLAYASFQGTDNLPSDLYFSDIDGSWDGDHDGIYGECPSDSIAGWTDVYVGFIPMDGPGDAHTFLNKLFRYEQNPGANYVEKTNLPVGISGVQYTRYTDSIANAAPSNWTHYKMYYPVGTSASFLDSIRAGFGYTAGIHHAAIDYIGHGSGQLVHSNDAIALNNQKLGVFISVGCDPGAWDHNGTVNGDCLAENACTKAPNGWAAIMFNARSGWIDVAEHYNYEFMYHALPTGIGRCSSQTWIGQCLARTKDHWIPKWNLGGDTSRFRWEAYERNLFGEPAMPLWNAEPDSLRAAHAGVVTIGNNIPYTVTVTSRTDVPVESALVLLWKGAEVYAKARTGSNGEVTIPVSPLTPGPMILSVNAHNFYMLVDTVRVISTDRYISYLRSTVTDDAPGGNGDSLLNPGETVEIQTWVKNWGQQAASAVNALLRTHDANATVVDSFKTFGTINAGDSAFTGTDGFGLQVAPGLNNGYSIPCSLICRDANDSVWVSQVSFTVGTAVLAHQGFTVIDSILGNGNGKLDPNEQAEMEITIRNTGLGHGYLCRAVLRSGNPLLVIDDSTSDFGTVRRGEVITGADHFVLTAGAIVAETPVPCTLHLYADGGIEIVVPLTIIVGQLTSVDPVPDGPRTPAVYYAYDNVDIHYPQHPTYNWVEIRNRGTRLTLSDDQTTTITLPPAFGPIRYYGQRYTQLAISSNGFVVPGTFSTAPYTETALPTSTIAGPAICAVWTDLYPPTGNGVWWYYDSTMRALVVEYDSVSHYPSASAYEKFEIIIYDTTQATPDGNSIILVQYMTANSLGSMTAGLQNQNYTIGINNVFDGAYHRACATLAPQRAILYAAMDPTGIAEEFHAQTAPARTALQAWPNPARGLSNVAWSVAAEGRVALKVYDPSGRVIRSLVNSPLKAGRYTATWDGRDESGRDVAAGIYFYRLETSDGTTERKLILTR